MDVIDLSHDDIKTCSAGTATPECYFYDSMNATIHAKEPTYTSCSNRQSCVMCIKTQITLCCANIGADLLSWSYDAEGTQEIHISQYPKMILINF